MKTATLAEIDHLSTIDPDDIPDGSKCLLELDFSATKNAFFPPRDQYLPLCAVTTTTLSCEDKGQSIAL